MAAQIPIVATTATPGIARSSKKRPASPSHNGSSAGGYSASKKKKSAASSFAQVGCSSTNMRVPGGRAGRDVGFCAGPWEAELRSGRMRVARLVRAHALGFVVSPLW